MFFIYKNPDSLCYAIFHGMFGIVGGRGGTFISKKQYTLRYIFICKQLCNFRYVFIYKNPDTLRHIL